MPIDILYPKKWRQLGYDPNKPEKERRRAISLLATADRNFENTFSNLRKCKTAQVPFSKESRRLKKDWIYYRVHVRRRR